MKKEKSQTPNTWPILWRAHLIDAGDGSGDQVIELPDDLMEQMGWELGDTLDLELTAEKKIIVRKLK